MSLKFSYPDVGVVTLSEGWMSIIPPYSFEIKEYEVAAMTYCEEREQLGVYLKNPAEIYYFNKWSILLI